MWVTEIHTDNIAIDHKIRYLAAVGTDYNAVMFARQPWIEALLINQELHIALATDDVPSLNYATLDDLGAFVREKYRNAASIMLAQIAKWLQNRITEGTWTQTQVRNFFGLTQTDWNTLATKMQNLIAAYDEVIAAVGE